VINTLPEGEPVGGVTSLDNRLYVLRSNKFSEQIEVYDIDTYCAICLFAGLVLDVTLWLVNKILVLIFLTVHTTLCIQ